ncbi:hypothetical protein JIN85_03880 [Luteolibacter pohnpeiensis]|uniref:Alpha-2-macroglobulin n=1 Tax=Luteolibacter pohnpeiensis TaxID=454153 RepID=A0A934VUV7_9BACT|nr:MG2 domain-containing protein [Luteolibacter pohnpeiensis]MBK1881540.1 hypothetical protein [Luteolibacter pohnpeiensis]
MKSFFHLLAAGLFFQAVASAEPRLVVSTPSIAPESQIDIVLDKPFVETAEIGKTVDNHLIEIEPPIPGKITWTAQNIARLVPEIPPTIGTSFKFSLAPDQVYLDGTEVPTATFATANSEAFRISIATQPNRWSHDYSRSNSQWLVVFNDDVDPAKLGSYITFSSKSGDQVAAEISRPTLGQLGYRANYYRSWSSRFPGDPPASKPEDPVPFAIFATPAFPLPVGEDWKLSILKGLPNSNHNARLDENSEYQIGTIEPFKISSLNAVANPDEDRYLEIQLNYKPASPLPADFLTRNITIKPRPQNLSAEIKGESILLHGDFSNRHDWTLKVHGRLSSEHGYLLSNSVTNDLKFKVIQPQLVLPSTNQAQLANGNRQYPMLTVNLSQLHVRLKQLAPNELVRAYQGYRHYTGEGPNNESSSQTSSLPYSLITGKTILDESFELGTKIDSSKTVTLDWNDLLPEGTKTTAFFLDVTGTPHDGLHIDHKRNSQAIIQLTDIGLAWKFNDREAFIFAFSCSTGQPLEGVSIDLFGEDSNSLVSKKTNHDGLVMLPRPPEAQNLRARLGDDTYITAFDTSLSTVGLWHFPVRYSWNKPLDKARRAFLFTDRSLYRPGEMVHLKGIVRIQQGNEIQPIPESNARVVILDPSEKEIYSSPVHFSEHGSFDLNYQLPPSQTGDHAIRLEFPDDLQLAEDSDNWSEKYSIRNNASFYLPLRVEEFRRNAFEIEQTLPDTVPGATRLSADISARYYQGQPVAAGSVNYFTRITSINPYPERFSDFLFGNHREVDWQYWYHYFGYRWGDGNGSRQTMQHEGETTLTPEGTTTVAVDLPESDFPTAREVTLSTEVTDANHQTLRSTATTTVHPASIYVGISRLDRLVRTGDKVELKIVATDTSGEPYPDPVRVTATLSRKVNKSVKMQNQDGETVTRNDVTEPSISITNLTITPKQSAHGGQSFIFTPEENGEHYLTIRGTDPQGHDFATVTSFTVYGSDEYPWLYEDGMRIKLVSEKKSYKPGDTARILVLSPIEGTALVTVEREKVLRSFLVPLKAEKPVIEIPITENDAPNAYVSVLIVKGAAESARAIKEPQLRLGYCELTVESDRDRVQLSLDAKDPSALTAASPKSFRPGDSVSIVGTATLADGSPASDAEVTLYAEDEGTLAVMGYETPAPHAFFYNPRLLNVQAGTSFESFISEDVENTGFFNKGFFVGGGGDLGALNDLYRKNFNPCATWIASLKTDASGKFTHTFRAPDTLTRYRVIAVASQGATKFGHAESSILINKPLMLEPKAPRFANQSDTFNPQVLVQNSTDYSGTWEVTLTSSSDAGSPTCRLLGPSTQTISLQPKSSGTLVFPLIADSTGNAVLSWKATPVSLADRELTPALNHSLSDAVQARFPVYYPMPLLRQSEFVKLDTAGTDNLLKHLDADLLTGDGSIELEFSQTPLLGAAGSIDYLFSYPHGCVEQTTSSLMPWFALESLQQIIPAFTKITAEKKAKAIQAGVDRLLSMQLPDGSFSYWPGGTEAADWATSYAGLGLILARNQGADVPESAINSLTTNLISNLRGISDIKSAYQLECQARALWVLALAGKPQPAYQSIMIDRMADLNSSARCLLALAMFHSTKDSSAAISVLTSSVPFKNKDDNWMRWHGDQALKLLAWSTISPEDPQVMDLFDRLLNDRDAYGNWRTTWLNGWSLLAISQFANSEKQSSNQMTIDLETPAGHQSINLPPASTTQAITVPITRDLKLNLTHQDRLYARIKLEAKPEIAPIQPVSNNGMSIDRTYEKIHADGTSEFLSEPQVGDLIRVTLKLTLPQDDTRYLVVEDPLPATFEIINSDFSSQSATQGGRTSESDWKISHSELRDDRADFYLNRMWNRGTYTITYLARCTMAGKATAPPAKVETMYDPDNYALSQSRVFQSDIQD